MASLSGASITIISKIFSNPSKPNHQLMIPMIKINNVSFPSSKHHQVVITCSRRTRASHVAYSAPAEQQLSEKVEESIKKAEEACSGDAVSGECAALWDEVEELSAAASHARDKKKLDSDPLENYCKENPETDECRTYDN